MTRRTAHAKLDLLETLAAFPPMPAAVLIGALARSLLAGDPVTDQVYASADCTLGDLDAARPLALRYVEAFAQQNREDVVGTAATRYTPDFAELTTPRGSLPSAARGRDVVVSPSGRYLAYSVGWVVWRLPPYVLGVRRRSRRLS